MGRPINKRYIGNTAQSGQQIRATAWIPGDAAPSTAWISKQVANKTYNMVNAAGQTSGRVTLTQGGVALQPGEANIAVTPYGASGSGVVAGARMKAASATIVTAGTGAVTADYNVNDTLTVSGGTGTAPVFTVATVRGRILTVQTAGTNTTWANGDTITFSGAGWSTPAVAVVTGNGSGGIASLTFVGGAGNKGVRTTSIPADPVSPTSTSNAGGLQGLTVNIGFEVNTITLTTPGSMSALPSNPVSTTTGGSGAGATMNVVYNVNTVVVTNGGSDFDSASVVFSPSGAAATATINAAGSVSGIVVTNSGPNVTAVPAISVGPLNIVEYAQEIRNRTVYTFNGNTYEWIMSDQDLVSSDQARIQSA